MWGNVVAEGHHEHDEKIIVEKQKFHIYNYMTRSWTGLPSYYIRDRGVNEESMINIISYPTMGGASCMRFVPIDAIIDIAKKRR